MKRLSYKYVRDYFKEHGCELLEEGYQNNSTKMKYRCECKNISKISFLHFKQGKRCSKCGGSEKFTFEYVGDYFKELAIEFAWDLLINGYGLPMEKLWVSVFKEDDEAYQLWHKNIGVSEDRIVRA